MSHTFSYFGKNSISIAGKLRFFCLFPFPFRYHIAFDLLSIRSMSASF